MPLHGACLCCPEIPCEAENVSAGDEDHRVRMDVRTKMQYKMLSLPDPVTFMRTSVGLHASSRHALVGTDAA